MRKLLPLALALLAACGDTSGPDTSHVPQVGTYNFSLSPSIPGRTVVPISGQLVITDADAERLRGYWHAPGVEPALKMGSYNVDAYVVVGSHTQGLITLRLSRQGAANNLSCVGRFMYEADNRLAQCSISYAG